MIKIYSTFSKDIVSDENNNISIKKYGPAFFMENIFKKYNVDYELNPGATLEILIDVKDGVETGEIKSKNIKSQEITNISSDDIVVVSTIGREWVLGNNVSPEARIFLDIQGYARTNNLAEASLANLFCLKGTKEEINKVPKDIVEKQKDRCLIITNGKNSSLVYYKNTKYKIKANRIDAKNTIGAGDTFFATFIVEFLKTNDAEGSALFAAKEVEKFLLEKKG